jgi:hypothetical protein
MGHHTYFLTIYKGIFQIAKLPVLSNVEGTGKGANLPSIALGEGGFLSILFTTKSPRHKVVF